MEKIYNFAMIGGILHFILRRQYEVCSKRKKIYFALKDGTAFQ